MGPLGLDNTNPLGVYVQEFEEAFLDETLKFYKNENVQTMNLSVSELLLHIEKRMDEENKRVIHYLHHSTKEKLMRIFVSVNIEGNLDYILSLVSIWFDNESFKGVNF